MSKVALVTGAGSGVGRAATQALLNDGFHVVLCGRREAKLQETAESSEAADRTTAMALDVCDADSVDQVFAQVREQLGRLDVLFNNAGINAPAVPLEDLQTDDWRAVVDTNLTGSFLCTRAAFQIMKEQDPMGGRIINNGSISAWAPRPFSVAYTATKHAITGLTKSTSLDGRKYNIACGQIDIGNAATEMTARMKNGVPQADGSIAVEPTMDVNDVGRAVAMMAGLPLEANVQFMTIMATKMPLVGRG